MNRKTFIGLLTAASAALATGLKRKPFEPKEWTVGSGMRVLLDGTIRIDTRAESGKFSVHKVTIFDGNPERIVEIQTHVMSIAKLELFEMVKNA
jgi:hypothetical protein